MREDYAFNEKLSMVGYYRALYIIFQQKLRLSFISNKKGIPVNKGIYGCELCSVC